MVRLMGTQRKAQGRNDDCGCWGGDGGGGGGVEGLGWARRKTMGTRVEMKALVNTNNNISDYHNKNDNGDVSIMLSATNPYW